MRSRRAMAVVGLLGLLVSGAAEAGDDGSFFGVSAGIKGGAGGNLWTAPTDLPPKGYVPGQPIDRPWPLFDDYAGGYGGGVGAFGEFRVLWGYLGLELGLLWDRSINWTTITVNDVVETKWTVTADHLRIPLLLKGNLQLGSVRLSLGIGPEFVIGVGADPSYEITDGGPMTAAQITTSEKDTNSKYKAKEQTDTILCMDLGLAIEIWELAITLDLRFGYNLTQPAEYTKRVDWDGEIVGREYQVDQVEVIASSSADLRILLGVAYELEFGL